MKKIYESPLNGWDESAERIHVYALESNDEYWDVSGMTHQDKCEYFDVEEATGYNVAPGALYKMYEFDVSGTHVIMRETVAYNV